MPHKVPEWNSVCLNVVVERLVQPDGRSAQQLLDVDKMPTQAAF